jgi:hypothetical protein
MTALVKYDAMCRAIDAAYEVDEVKAIHDHAQMLQAAARVAGNHDAEMRAYEIRMRAARKAGELSKKIEKAPADRKSEKIKSGQGGVDPKGRVLANAGISTQQASDWERLAGVPKEDFEAAFNGQSRPSIDALIGKHGPGDASPKAKGDSPKPSKGSQDQETMAFLAGLRGPASMASPGSAIPKPAPARIDEALRVLEQLENEFTGELRVCEALKAARGELMRLRNIQFAKQA